MSRSRTLASPSSSRAHKSSSTSAARPATWPRKRCAATCSRTPWATPRRWTCEWEQAGQVNDRLIGVHFRLIRRWACGVIMFTLLVGCPPFWHRKQMVMLRNIMEGKYSFTSPEWAEISGECSYSWYSSLGQPNVCNNNRKSSLKAQVWIKTEIPRVLQRIPRIWSESAWLWTWRSESQQKRLSSIHSSTRW